MKVKELFEIFCELDSANQIEFMQLLSEKLEIESIDRKMNSHIFIEPIKTSE